MDTFEQLREELRTAERARYRMEWKIEEIAGKRASQYARVVINRFRDFTRGMRLGGDDSPLKDAWEEYKDQIQGQHGLYFGMFSLQIEEIARAVVEELPTEEKLLLWMGTEAFRDSEDDERYQPYLDEVEKLICRGVDEIADTEEISRS